jgi:hypothetical protein
MCSQLTPFAPLVSKLNNTNTSSPETDTEQPVIIDEENTEEESPYSVTVSSFQTVDLEGYCTINIPLSHFTLDEVNSTKTYKQVNYYDDKTRLYMSYITGMESGTDIPGYICNEAAGVDTLTNDKVTEVYNEVEWIKVTADSKTENGSTVYIWYTLNKKGDSAFWIKAIVPESSDNQVFADVMTQTLNTYYLYVASGTLFETPTTGFYADNYVPDNTVADSSDYKANDSNTNQVISARGGYVVGADISNSWKKMEIIIDGTKFKLPQAFSDFQDAGFKINDSSIETSDDLIIDAGSTMEVRVMDDVGTVLILTCYNNNEIKEKSAKKCNVVAIEIDASTFSDKKATKSDEVYNEETANDSNASKTAKDNYNHELILAHGLTWGVYADDLISYYGKCEQDIDSEEQEMTWTSDTKSLTIKTGAIKGIKYVKMACKDYD